MNKNILSNIFIELFQIYSLKPVFYQNILKVLTKVFYIKIWFKCDTPLVFFLIRTMLFFSCRLCKNYWITYCTHMKSHVIWADKKADVMISIKRSIKAKTFLKSSFLNRFYLIFHFLSLCVFKSIQHIGWSIPLSWVRIYLRDDYISQL